MNTKKAKEQDDVSKAFDAFVRQLALILGLTFLVWLAWVLANDLSLVSQPAEFGLSADISLLYFSGVLILRLTGLTKTFWRLLGR